MSEPGELTRVFYEQHAEEFRRNTEMLNIDQWIERFLSLLPASKRVLDAGCAFGRDCVTFLEHGCETHGIDFSPHMIALAEFHRVLKSAGILFLSVKAGSGEGIVKDSRYAGAEKYQAHYAESELRSLLSQLFDVIEVVFEPYEGDKYRTPTLYALARKK